MITSSRCYGLNLIVNFFRCLKKTENSQKKKERKKVEVALLSELEFKHQVTTARGREGGGAWGMRALRWRGVQRTGSGMEGGEGEV